MRRGAGYNSDNAVQQREQLGAPPIPNLPGHSYFNHALAQTAAQLGARKSRAATLKYVHGCPVVEDPAVQQQDPLSRFSYTPSQEALLGEIRKKTDQEARAPVQSTSQGTYGVHTMRWTGQKTPGWLMYDKKVLRFQAFSLDKVQFNPLEDVRVRRFQFSYNMEDDTLEIEEPQQPNSGLPQGKYLQRHKVKMADGTVLKYPMLRVGSELTIYSRKFTITGCDLPTREFYSKDLGQEQPPDIPQPSGSYDEYQKARAAEEEARRNRHKLHQHHKQAFVNGEDVFEDPRGPEAVFQFFPDRKVQDHLDGVTLCFFCCWDDTKRMFGQKLPFALHYYPKDDTIQVIEMHRRNTGRDPFPLLLSRGKLPKTPNVPPVGGRPMSPRSRMKLNIQYYHWRDMRVGSIVKVYGRDLLIYDMDPRTKEWMKAHAELSEKDLTPIAVDFDMGPKRPPLQVPPHITGIGSEEDSMQSVLHLVPKRPNPAGGYSHYMENWNKVFRFSARMTSAKGFPVVGPHDAERRFIISYHVLDNTISIYEPKRSNSGMRGGTFLERTKVKKHSSAEFFSDLDFQVGAVLIIYSRAWELLDADHYTLRYMENEAQRYPYADFSKIMDRLQGTLRMESWRGDELRTQLIRRDEAGQGYVTATQMMAAMHDAGLEVSKHEAITLVRHIGADYQGVVAHQLLSALGLSAPNVHPESDPGGLGNQSHDGQWEQYGHGMDPSLQHDEPVYKQPLYYQQPAQPALAAMQQRTVQAAQHQEPPRQSVMPVQHARLAVDEQVRAQPPPLAFSVDPPADYDQAPAGFRQQGEQALKPQGHMPFQAQPEYGMRQTSYDAQQGQRGHVRVQNVQPEQMPPAGRKVAWQEGGVAQAMSQPVQRQAPMPLPASAAHMEQALPAWQQEAQQQRQASLPPGRQAVYGHRQSESTSSTGHCSVPYSTADSMPYESWRVLAGAPEQQMWETKQVPSPHASQAQHHGPEQEQRVWGGMGADGNDPDHYAVPTMDDHYNARYAHEDANILPHGEQQWGAAPSGRPVRFTQDEAVPPPAHQRPQPSQTRPDGHGSRPYQDTKGNDAPVMLNAPRGEWMAAGQARQQRIDDTLTRSRTMHSQDAAVIVDPGTNKQSNGSFSFRPFEGGGAGKENAGGVSQPVRDPRWAPPPGGIGYGLDSTLGKAAANKSSMDAISKMQQPKSLWQTTNMAMGGVHNNGSFRRA